MSQQDYYALLGVAPTASAAEVKRAFRKLALETHPDRNPDRSGAEERFKTISEAYGVLSDPEKRAQYDQYRRLGFRPAGGGQAHPGFGYSQEEIFRDFFGNQASREVFAEMQREFAKMGFRFDDRFINNLFFGGNPYVFHGGMGGGPTRVRVFRFGNFAPHGAPKAGQQPGTAPQKPPSLAKPLLKLGAGMLLQAGKNFGRYLVDKVTALNQPAPKQHLGSGREADVLYQLVIRPEDADSGTVIDVRMPHLKDSKIVAVKIPPGVHSGTKLRLKNMGRPLPGSQQARGDVYIELQFG